jgi:uncharacterized protein
MPVHLTTPGVYIEEISSGVHTITGVATSIAAFVGYTSHGVDDRAKRILSFADFERAFGGLAADSELSYAVQHFFQNGGAEAYVVRVSKVGATPATMLVRDEAGNDALQFTALSKGESARDVLIDVDYEGAADADTFNLTVSNVKGTVVELFNQVTMDTGKSNFVQTVVNDDATGSKMVKVEPKGGGRPAQTGTTGATLTLDKEGQLTSVPAGKTLGIRMTTDTGAGAATTKNVELLKKGEPLPVSVQAVTRLLEHGIQQALNDVPGATVRCFAVRSMSTTTPPTPKLALRVVVHVPKAFDTVVEFAKLSGGGPDVADADGFLHLKAGTPNVAHYWLGSGRKAAAQLKPTGGAEGTALPGAAELIGSPGQFTGIFALDKVDLFNTLCIPDATRPASTSPTSSPLTQEQINDLFGRAAEYCARRRAFLLIDPPSNVQDADTAATWKSLKLTVRHPNAAAYFPRLRLPDPLNKSQLRTFAPSGVVAGLFARIDASRGVWKAPAGVEATLSGVQALGYPVTDGENGVLNPLGVNCLRIFPIYGPVCWGARTLVGSDAEGNEWKYVPVRRFALFLEESLFRGTKWVVFEPNDDPLWAQIRLNIGAFMQTLFRQGAFQGKTPREAYFVKCDGETTTQADINRGVVNILVGFAPLKPAEFVVIQIQQIAGEIQV